MKNGVQYPMLSFKKYGQYAKACNVCKFIVFKQPQIFAKLNNFLATSHMCCVVSFHEHTENAKRK